MDKEEIEIHDTSQSETDMDGATSIQCTEPSLNYTLLNLGLNEEQVEFIVANHKDFLNKPIILGKKLKISQDLADKALEIFKSSKQQQLTNEDIEKIIITVKENPDVDDPEDIALLSNVEKSLVLKYFEMQPLNEAQKKLIGEKYHMGNNINEISEIIKIPTIKIEKYIQSTFITFWGEEGKKVLGIINNLIGDTSEISLRRKIRSKGLKFQNQFISMQQTNKHDYQCVEKYFIRYEEGRDFLKIQKDLDIDDILRIKKSREDNIELLSPRLNKPESVISKYFQQYFILPVEAKHFQGIQEHEIVELSKIFEKKNISLEDYRIIITRPYDDIIRRIEAGKTRKKLKKLIFELLPLIFYYLKCNLPFEDLAQTIYDLSKISITAHALFHIIFQLSDPVLKGLCIEHYSFSNTVPLYYPKLKNLSESNEIQFGVCKELWYCLEQYNGLISFGLGRASWNAVGKSSLLDTMFDTDFVKGSPQSSAFHYRSIDIQITKNLFGETQQNLESTKWAFIDCHSHSDLNIIQTMCSHLDVALIHVCNNDYNRNRSDIEGELRILKSKLKHIYIFIRDCECEDVEISNEIIDGASQTIVFIPDLTIKEMKYWRKSLKQIGHDIFHLNIESSQLIESQFILDLFKASDNSVAKDLEGDQQLIRSITEMLDGSSIIQYKFLNYYPSFVEFMSSYHQASHDQDNADKHSLNCEMMDKTLKSTKMGKIIKYFNDILKKENSTLILFKLSKELSHISKIINSRRKRSYDIVIEEKKNDNYTIEILWRESLLFHKYAEDSTNQHYKKLFISNYSNHVGNGEAFELIDGDNLRFFNKEIDTLLSQYYLSQNELLTQINKGKSIQIKSAPIVVSILGPQSSGKSTLLNYCFGCKFLTSAGRCTRGIYASLSKLDNPINLSQSFLILDTEGLDAIERENIKDTSKINFDRTMVLFCLCVSQVVIINVKGDIGSEMQNLLQICAYSLNRLKVNKVKVPKIFFVLNQQADPDPNKHLNTMHLLMDKLSSDSLMEAEGVKISDLIQISSENLFVLPLAFNSQQMNDTSGKLFDSDVIKLSTTITFANKCTKLRLAIINQLDHMPLDARAPYQNMSEWMEMAGVIWDTIIEYQDVFKCRVSEELKCSNKLDQIVEELMEEHFYSHQNEFAKLTVSLCDEIKSIKSYVDPNIILTEKMNRFDELFMKNKFLCLGDFTKKCQNDPFFKKMSVICEERAWNFKRLIYVVRTQYENQIKMHIKLALAEINLTENMKKFKLTIAVNVEKYLNFSKQELEEAFENSWKEIFCNKDLEEENQEREEDFSNLYSIFKMEYNSMEEEGAISQLFRKHKFDMDKLVESLKGDILAKFLNDSPDQAEPFINTLIGYHTPIKDMIPYNGGSNYTYLSPNSFYETHASYSNSKLCSIKKLKPYNWVPTRCEGLLQYCSGLYSYPDIIWNPKKSTQVNRLKSLLRDDEKLPIWQGFIKDICDVPKLLNPDSDVSSAVVKRLIHDFCLRIKILNYEIGFIHACLSNFAERALSTLVFAYAFENRRTYTNKIKRENRQKKETKKKDLRQYFNQKIEDHKMICGNWDREWMRSRDKEISKKYTLYFIESVKRSLKTSEQQNLMNLLEFTCRKESLSHESMLFLALERIREEVKKAPGEKVTDTNNFVIQYICNRNETIQKIFREKWNVVEAELKQNISNHMKCDFIIKISNLNEVLNALILNLESQKNKDFDSDNYFKLIGHGKTFTETKEIPYKAMNIYFRKYLDPTVSKEDINTFLFEIFEVDGIQVKVCETYTLPCKYSEPVLDEDTFRKLVNTEMFNETELIFNIHNFLNDFQSHLGGYSFELNQDDFQEIILNLKKEFEKNVIGCSCQCPSCGKFCEREIHTNEGKCQIKTGHQISSMGGNVWNADESTTAVLFICDDYKEHTQINLSGNSLTWGEFKNVCGSEWDWNLPNEKKYKYKQQDNPKLMKDVWNKYGDGILNYLNEKHQTAITFVPYTTFEQVNEPLFPSNYYICFVVDGTGSMNIDIARVIVSVGQLISSFISCGNSAQFRVVIYRDHCDENLLETFPNTNDFTSQQNTVEDFLRNINTIGGGDFPEAVLDGLATAASQSDWRRAPGVKNKIIHIFDAPPHGDFPEYKSHKSFSNKKSCCCCNHNTICKFDWERDVWSKFKEYNIEYHPINTTPSQLEIKTFTNFKKGLKKKLLELRHWISIDLIFSNYESKMREELGRLCGNYQVVGKEIVNDAILKIFVDRKEEGETNGVSVSFRFDSLSVSLAPNFTF